MLGGALMSKMRNMVLEAVQMNGIENVIMPLMNEIFLSFTDIAEIGRASCRERVY